MLLKAALVSNSAFVAFLHSSYADDLAASRVAVSTAQLCGVAFWLFLGLDVYAFRLHTSVHTLSRALRERAPLSAADVRDVYRLETFGVSHPSATPGCTTDRPQPEGQQQPNLPDRGRRRDVRSIPYRQHAAAVSWAALTHYTAGLRASRLHGMLALAIVALHVACTLLHVYRSSAHTGVAVGASSAASIIVHWALAPDTLAARLQHAHALCHELLLTESDMDAHTLDTLKKVSPLHSHNPLESYPDLLSPA